jgi:hypothetical protein
MAALADTVRWVLFYYTQLLAKTSFQCVLGAVVISIKPKKIRCLIYQCAKTQPVH